MPHFVLEYAETLVPAADVQAMMSDLADKAGALGFLNPDDIKLRAIAYRDFQMGNGTNGFVHLAVFLLGGRTSEQKVTLAETCRASLIRTCPQADAISVDIRDLDPVPYKKRVRLPVPAQ